MVLRDSVYNPFGVLSFLFRSFFVRIDSARIDSEMCAELETGLHDEAAFPEIVS